MTPHDWQHMTPEQKIRLTSRCLELQRRAHGKYAMQVTAGGGWRLHAETIARTDALANNHCLRHFHYHHHHHQQQQLQWSPPAAAAAVVNC
jgi:hypothetical protein